MSRCLILAVALALLLPVSVLASMPSARVVLVPSATPVIFHLGSPLSSKEAKEGDRFSFVVVKPVIKSGMIVIPAKAVGEGHVTKSSRAKWMGRPGTLFVVFDWVTSADGKRILLSDTPNGVIGGGNDDTAAGVSIASSVVTDAAITSGAALSGAAGAAVPYLAFAPLVVKGKDITIGTDQALRAFVAEEVHVKTSLKAPEDDIYDH